MDINKRVDELRSRMADNDIAVSFISNYDDQYYLSDYKTIIYSRPILFAATMDKSYMIVPGLEEDHAKSMAQVNEVFTYYEHPEKTSLGDSPFFFIDKILSGIPADRDRSGVRSDSIVAGTVFYRQGLCACRCRRCRQRNEIHQERRGNSDDGRSRETGQ